MSSQPLNLFISYSHKDEDLKEELEIHLATLKRQGQINPWQDRAIEAGTAWDPQIKAQLEAAAIILLLITPRFMASDYIHDVELKRALERHQAGTARVIPIILKPTDLKDTPIAALQALPKDAKPVTTWTNQDEAFLNVVQGLRRVLTGLIQTATPPTPPDPARPEDIPSPPPTGGTVAANSIQPRLALIQLLYSLPEAQFNQIVSVLKPPAGNVPPSPAALGQRVPALLEWVESPIGCGLTTLEAVIRAVVQS